MGEVAPLKYRAFLSYSHRDTRVAKRLHRGLETFKIDADLVGRETDVGPVPKSLRPIFRDRHDFSAGHDLGAATLPALETSRFLLVLCSPAAAKSEYVNEEIRQFRVMTRGAERESAIVPVIADGQPGDPELECFPPALRFELDADGEITDQPVALLAADVRDMGDGWDLAIAKVAARLMGLGTDEVFRRAERERRRRERVRTAVIAALAVLSVTASASGLWAFSALQRVEATLASVLEVADEQRAASVDRIATHGIERANIVAELDGTQKLIDKLDQLQRVTPELKHQRARLSIELSRIQALLGDLSAQRDSAETAHALMLEVARERPDDLFFQRELSITHVEIGELAEIDRNYDLAREHYAAAREIRGRLVAADSENLGWRRDLAIILAHSGRLSAKRGQPNDALRDYRASLILREALARAHEADAEQFATARRDVTIVLERLGELALDRGDLDAAQKRFERCLLIRIELVDADPENVRALDDLGVAHTMMARSLVARAGTRAEDSANLQAKATAHWRAAQELFAELAVVDPNNMNRQRNLAAAEKALGEDAGAQGDWLAARTHFAAERDARARLVQAEPERKDRRLDLARSEAALGAALRESGDVAQATKRYEAAIDIFEALDAKGALDQPQRRELQRLKFTLLRFKT